MAPTRVFVYDPQTRRVIYTYDLGAFGPPAWNPMKAGPDGRLYVLAQRGILRVQPGTFTVEKLADPPVAIFAGLAIANGKLFFTAGSHVWGFALPQ